uniref:Putative secreted protein n=1 Tax=Ixodes ricinus TaxID=34613 RepID=A0A6B0U2X1_IXORI
MSWLDLPGVVSVLASPSSSGKPPLDARRAFSSFSRSSGSILCGTVSVLRGTASVASEETRRFPVTSVSPASIFFFS